MHSKIKGPNQDFKLRLQ